MIGIIITITSGPVVYKSQESLLDHAKSENTTISRDESFSNLSGHKSHLQAESGSRCMHCVTQGSWLRRL